MPTLERVQIYGRILFTEPHRSETAKVALEAEGYRVEAQRQDDPAVVLLAIPPENSLTPEI